jgi:methyl-accepting chemotaxis protein
MVWTIGKKLSASFGGLVSLLAVMAVVLISTLATLARVQNEGATRAKDAVAITEAVALSRGLYQVWADTIINHNVTEAAKDWKLVREEAEKDAAGIEKMVDTDAEKAWLKDYGSSYAEFVALYEKELLAMVQAGKFSGPEIEALAAKADGLVEKMTTKLHELSASFVKESEQADDEFDKLISGMRAALIVAALLAVVGAALAAFFVTQNIVRDINVVSKMSERISEGDVRWHCSEAELRAMESRGDEIGVLCRAMQQLVRYINEKKEVVGQVAKGNLNVSPKVASDADEFGKSLAAMVNSLNEIMQQLVVTSQHISEGAGQVASASQTLSSGASMQASSVEEISAAVNEITSQAKENAEKAESAAVAATEAQQAAEMGSGKIATTVEAIRDIAESSKQISRVIKLIDDIAFQTNLLALNAAVEAARAGKHGKGFAVVADEVRNLAGRSAKAAQETSELVETSVQKVEKGVAEANETANSFTAIVKGTTDVSGALSTIRELSQNQATAAVQMAQGLGQVNQVTQETAASSEQNAATAEELSGLVQQLREVVSRFRVRA